VKTEPIVRWCRGAAGSIGIPGLYVTEDPGAVGGAAKRPFLPILNRRYHRSLLGNINSKKCWLRSGVDGLQELN